MSSTAIPSLPHNGSMDHYDAFRYEYGYDYNYDDSVNSLPLDEVIPAGLAYSLILLLGLVGNSLVIFSIGYYGRMRNVTNVFLMSLASADLLLILICVPIKFAAFFSFTWTFGAFLCKAVHYMQNVSMICSVWTLTVISIERFVAIRYPLKAKSLCTMRHAQIVVVCVWLQAFIMALPIIFGRNHKQVGVVRVAYWCQKEWSRQMYSILYEMYMLIVMLVIPGALMLTTYIFISLEVWRLAGIRANMRSGRATGAKLQVPRKSCSKSDSGDSSSVPLTAGRSDASRSRQKKSQSDDQETRKQVVLMLMVVVLVFFVCWTPIIINNVLTAFGVIEPLHHGWLRYMRLAFFLLSYMNSCVNPIVYAFMSKNFRQTFKFAVCACIKGKAFVRMYRFSRSFNSTRTSVLHTNGSVVYPNERENNSSDVFRPIMTVADEEVELQKMTSEKSRMV
ncbi:QRFP-like peptide receptor [Gigantopelta aegis]|uniref:QRFP-like peptide receptor n=1 Tax=Gigantopelta aegis TaxID=1735272 RepID=UPI001B88AAEE|nr:QRFP-like peptide receptor [Gigantopelta aegis]